MRRPKERYIDYSIGDQEDPLPAMPSTPDVDATSTRVLLYRADGTPLVRRIDFAPNLATS
jgi:hypothetical protein